MVWSSDMYLGEESGVVGPKLEREGWVGQAEALG